MFKDEKEFKIFVDKLNIDTKSNSAHREKLKKQMLSVFEETSKIHTTGQQKPDLWRIIMKSPLTKIAAAAVIIIGVLFVSHFPIDSISITTPAFSKIIDNALSQKWVYMFEEDRKKGQIIAEYWYNPSNQKLYCKTGDDYAFVVDMDSGDEYEYRKGQITIKKRDDFDIYSGWIAERMPMISGLLDRYKKQGAFIQQKESVYNSQPAWLYEIQLTLPGDSFISTSTQTYKYSWLVNKKTNLPIICENTTISISPFNGESKRNIVNSNRYAFDYPNTGPDDIYALGVPSDVNIIDERINPDSEIQQLVAKINSIKETKYSSYAYISRQEDYLSKRVIKDGQNIREELLELKINTVDYLPKKEQYIQSMGQTFDSIDKWIEEAAIVQCHSIHIYNDQFNYETSDRYIKENKPVSISLQYTGTSRERINNSFIYYCWWNMPDGVIVKNSYSDENNLICTETSNKKYYYDPTKEYMCVRSETKEGEVKHEILEFDQTASGMLYPSKIQQGNYTIYLFVQDVNEKLKARLDPKSLPNYVDHRKLTIEVATQYAQKDSNDIEYTGFTPLHIAIYRQDMERIKTLLKKGAEVEPVYDSGATPMELAVASGNIEIVKLLYEHGADFISNDKEHRDALGLAVKEGYKEIAEFMLANGSNVDNSYKNQDTPLKYAADKGDLEMIKMLLKYNPQIDLKDTEGRTPLYYAVNSLSNKVAHFTNVEEEIVRNYEDVISLLIEHGADINIRDNQDYTPLLLTLVSYSASSKISDQQIDLIRFLLKMGADPDLMNDSASALCCAVESKYYDIIQILLEAGVDPWEQTTKRFKIYGYINFLQYARITKDDKLYDLLYPYMNDRYEQTNKKLVELTKKIVRACLDDDKEVIDTLCIDHPEYTKPWPEWAGKIKEIYQGHEDLLEKIVPGWFADDGLARTHIPLPDSTNNKSTTLGFIQLPDGQWKCFYYTNIENMPVFEETLRHSYAFEENLDRFWNLIYDNAGLTEKFTKRDSEVSISNDKYRGQVILTNQKGNLKIDFEEERYSRKRQFVITPDFIKVYNGNTLGIYTKEYIQKQKDYPDQLIYHPSELVIDTGDQKYIFTVSDGKILLTQGENKTEAEKFIFDLNSWKLL